MVFLAKIIAFIFIMCLNLTAALALHILFVIRLITFGPLLEAFSMLSGSYPGPKWPINRAAYGWQTLLIGTYEKIFRPQRAGAEFDNSFSFTKNFVMVVLFLGTYAIGIYIQNINIMSYAKNQYSIMFYATILIVFALGRLAELMLNFIYFVVIMLLSILCWPAVFISTFCEYIIKVMLSASGGIAAPNEKRLEWAQHIPFYAFNYALILLSDNNGDRKYGSIYSGLVRFLFSILVYFLTYSAIFEVPFQKYFWSFLKF